MIDVIIWFICGAFASIIFLTTEIRKNNYNTYDKFKDFLFGFDDGLFMSGIILALGFFSFVTLVIYAIVNTEAYKKMISFIGESVYNALYKLANKQTKNIDLTK